MKKIFLLLLVFCLPLLLFTAQTYAQEQLFEAISEHDLAKVQDLLAKGADPNFGAEDGTPALLAAIVLETPADLITLLIEAGADPNWAGEDGFTILMLALVMDSPLSVIKALVEGGAGVNARDLHGQTPLLLAMIVQRETAVIESLLHAGANVDAQDDDGFTALIYAAALSEDEKLIHLLLDAGADVFVTLADGQTILDLLENNSVLANSPVYSRIQDALARGSQLVFSFPEVLVPGATGFPTGYRDVITTEFVESFYLASHEVRYSLWQEVYAWATSAERGENRYYFWHEGEMGHNMHGPTTAEHPVTMITWFDSVNWCNALTEYYNFRNGTDLECVYYNKGVLCRDSRQASIYETMHDVEALPGHRGFRLPTSLEWDLAARYEDGVSWTATDYVSGGIQIDDPGIADYAWFIENSDKHTHPVGEKWPNALGIYDLSGNLSEYCFDFAPGRDSDDRVLRGGNYYSNRINLWLGGTPWVWPGSTYSSNGFRVARTP